MKESFLYLPDEKCFSAHELEKKLAFTYLLHNIYESEKEKEEIYDRGMKKKEDNKVRSKALALGEEHRSKIEAGFIPLVSIRWVDPKVGHGLFAEEEISVGSYVGEYTGLVRKNDRRYTEPLNDYLYEYPVEDYIGRSYVIDAKQGNMTRFINHSSNPNLKPVHVFIDGFYHLIFLSLCPIAKGTQLSYHYGPIYWYLREKPSDL